MSNLTQRDAFWNTLYDIAKDNQDVVLVSADMGAPSLDKFRKNLPGQFVNAGIAEQNAILLSAGLALAGKKVFTYAIAPFIVFRCLEQIRVNVAMMNLPVTIVGVGAGLGYEDSGPTHHLTEDIALMRSMPNIVTHGITDSVMAAGMAKLSCALKVPNYIRLERQVVPDLYKANTDFTAGVEVLRKGRQGYIVATGSTVHTALTVAEKLEKKKISLGVIDVYAFPINTKLFLKAVKGAKALISLEEHFLPGGLGSAVAEVLADNGVATPLKRLGLPVEKGYCYKYGGRENLRKYYGMDKESIERNIVAFLGK
jgi:transketolase